MSVLYGFACGCEDLKKIINMNNTIEQLDDKNTPPEILKAIERHNEKMKLGRCMTDSEIMEYLISTKK